MKTTVDTFINATGKENELQAVITAAQSKLNSLSASKSAYLSNASGWFTHASTYRNLSHEDWKDRNKKEENEYNALCNKSQCRGQGKSGRKTRFDRRYDEWMKGLNKGNDYNRRAADITNTAIPAQESVLENAKQALKDYQKTINGKLAAGHSLESATESAQLEIQQQEEAIVNAQTVADAQAEAIILKPKQDMTKLAIIGGVAIVGLIAFLRFRK